MYTTARSWTDAQQTNTQAISSSADTYARVDLRHISPVNFAQTMHEYYLDGLLSWDEYCMVGFPSELHPRFDATIGALTGTTADPYRPRDMLAMWESRVDFERRYNRDPREVRRAARILSVLRQSSRS